MRKQIRLVLMQAVGILLLIMAGAGLYFILAGRRAVQFSGDLQESQNLRKEVVYQGKTYQYNSRLWNILFLGIDKTGEVNLENTPGTAGQADCIMIFSMDRESGKLRILQISRDSMTDVDLYDMSGNYFTSVHAQIAAQYAYGNGEESSCWAMSKTVSRLLSGLPVDGYISVNIDAIRLLNDAVGGVAVTMTEDYTGIDPAFVKGETVVLTGEQAEKFVRSRNTDEQGSNNRRMERQAQYIPQLIADIREKIRESDGSYDEFYQLLSPFMVTDLSMDEIEELLGYEFTMDTILTVPGKVRAGEEFEEYHVDEEALQKLLIDNFYKLKE